MNKRQVGNAYEILAADYLRRQGYEILEQNFYCRGGEIDLIAREGEYLCFVEVKYRTGEDYGFPEEAVTFGKQQKMIRAARYYLMKHGYSMDTSCRFDVVAVCGEKITLYRNAFGE
ncbi:MAG: YraN family protein [Lachnospiraceae bacterium]|nr:YraN family protein [Lachnospiraceae bacterium]